MEGYDFFDAGRHDRQKLLTEILNSVVELLGVFMAFGLLMFFLKRL